MHHRAPGDEEVYRTLFLLSFKWVMTQVLGERIAWSCGYFQSSQRDTVYGTNIDAEYLPSECQARSPQ